MRQQVKFNAWKSLIESNSMTWFPKVHLLNNFRNNMEKNCRRCCFIVFYLTSIVTSMNTNDLWSTKLEVKSANISTEKIYF